MLSSYVYNSPINLLHVYISAGRDRTVDDGMRLDKGISKQKVGHLQACHQIAKLYCDMLVDDFRIEVIS